VEFPESELRNGFILNPDGALGRYLTPRSVFDAIGDGAKKRDYSNIRTPILALFAGDDGEPAYRPKDDRERAAIERFNVSPEVYVNRYKRALQSPPGGVRIIDVAGARHYIFISNEDEVLREIRVFLASL